MTQYEILLVNTNEQVAHITDIVRTVATFALHNHLLLLNIEREDIYIKKSKILQGYATILGNLQISASKF